MTFYGTTLIVITELASYAFTKTFMTSIGRPVKLLVNVVRVGSSIFIFRSLLLAERWARTISPQFIDKTTYVLSLLCH